MRIAFNKRTATQAQPRSKPYEIRDAVTQGLILRVQPSGHKAWIVTWAHGKRKTLGSVENLSLDDARAHARQALSEATQQRLPTLAAKKAPACSLREFLDDYYAPWASTELRRGERYVLRIKGRFAGMLDMPISHLDAKLLNSWWMARLASGSGQKPVERVTAHRDFAALRASLSKAVDWKLLEANPLLGLRQKSVQGREIVRFLSNAEESRLRNAMASRDAGASHSTSQRSFKDHLTPIVMLAMNTGMRRGEILSLDWTDVDFETRTIRVQARNAKSGRQRHIPLNNEAIDVLRAWKSDSSNDDEVFAPSDIKKGWGALLTTAAITNFRFHDLRHHFASRLVSSGVDLNVVRELLGHSDLKMTLRYAHLCPTRLASAVATLDASKSDMPA